MKAFTLVLALLMAFILEGCAAPAPTIAPIKYIVVRPPPSLIKSCAVTPPPDVDNYMLLTKEAREKLLSEYSISLLEDLNICNQRLLALPKWFDDQSNAYK